ncbi:MULTISPECIES: hypothetical protein [Methanobacterium]|jgi:hypothetical protein|uniref:Uncharacterized protein n=1 Tax=Methanobacterium veterum TaxID=408577 RepID=A0A9E4ZWM3_9EURY|nr:MULTISPECIES: hypothetical protein [Methanobacterium]MCZ3364988.1 hypothetical protein [Methanobacterium veterum]MCZ3372743.1 hypothetical protein [Methanobacterium veterum]
MPVRQRRSIRITGDEILFLIGESGELGILKAGEQKQIFIGTPDKEEIVAFLEPDDIIAVSAFENSKKAEKGIRCMLYLLREMNFPITVLPENHPTSRRLPMVVAAGDHINLSCNIVPGTHPEQDILCACDDLSDTQITASKDGVEVEGTVKKFKVEKF